MDGVAIPSMWLPHGSLTDAARVALEEDDAGMCLAKRDGKNRTCVSDAGA